MGTEPANGLIAVQAAIDEAARRAGRDPASVTLVAVSKVHGPEVIEPVLAAGQRVFGENRVQEAQGKWPAFKQAYRGVELHLIGPLQTNKAKDAVELFDVIESVDRPKLARALKKAMEETGKTPRLFVQVNTGEEDQKAGVIPGDLDAFVALCRDELGLRIEGLMCIPPIDEEPALHFALLEKLARRNGLENLSMGMSADFETAIAFGATHVRVGTAVFGTRPPKA